MKKLRVTIKFFSFIREALGESERTMLVSEEAKVGDAIEELKNQYPQLSKTIDCSFIAINEEYALVDKLLQEGDILAIIPPVSGG